MPKAIMKSVERLLRNPVVPVSLARGLQLVHTRLPLINPRISLTQKILHSNAILGLLMSRWGRGVGGGGNFKGGDYSGSTVATRGTKANQIYENLQAGMFDLQQARGFPLAETARCRSLLSM